MKRKQLFGVISNIVLTVLYTPCSAFLCVFGLMLLTALPYDNWSFSLVLSILMCIILVATPIFSVVGIVLPIIKRKDEKYTSSFLIQFLPLITCGFSLFLFIVCSIWGNL